MDDGYRVAFLASSTSFATNHDGNRENIHQKQIERVLDGNLRSRKILMLCLNLCNSAKWPEEENEAQSLATI